jgi:hypothetical protein
VPKKGGKKDKAKSAAKKSKSCRPKKKCCVSKDKCRRCPLMMLKNGTLPEGYTVKKRKLVKVDPEKGRAPKKQPLAA